VEYLVTMTTHVPEGTSEQVVNDVRAREAAHSRELAAGGQLLRLWRPPLRPGEWRTLGLFAADTGEDLEKILASMPLRVWRTDDVTPLGPHANDPGPERRSAPPGSREFLVELVTTVPEGTTDETVDDTKAREAERAHELASTGQLVRLWALRTLPGGSRVLGLWRAQNEAEMQSILDSLPLRPWLTAETIPLSAHPSDPAAPGVH
jgi:muconolactone delta-isomerase